MKPCIFLSLKSKDIVLLFLTQVNHAHQSRVTLIQIHWEWYNKDNEYCDIEVNRARTGACGSLSHKAMCVVIHPTVSQGWKTKAVTFMAPTAPFPALHISQHYFLEKKEFRGPITVLAIEAPWGSLQQGCLRILPLLGAHSLKRFKRRLHIMKSVCFLFSLSWLPQLSRTLPNCIWNLLWLNLWWAVQI